MLAQSGAGKTPDASRIPKPDAPLIYKNCDDANEATAENTSNDASWASRCRSDPLPLQHRMKVGLGIGDFDYLWFVDAETLSVVDPK